MAVAILCVELSTRIAGFGGKQSYITKNLQRITKCNKYRASEISSTEFSQKS
jgi:hypothetical protein